MPCSQKTVSTYLYLYVTQADTKRSIWMWMSSFFYIGHSLVDIRREVGYLLDIWSIKQSKFDIQILVK